MSNKIKVLVVDDSAYNRQTISRMLESHPDIQVAERAFDGQDAIKKVMQIKPDVITLDLEMPRMDGFTFLRWLMTQEPCPVIVISAHEGDENVFRALEMGAFDFIAKPGRMSTKLAELQDLLVSKVLVAARSNIKAIARNQEETSARPIAVPTIKKPMLNHVLSSRFAIAVGASTGGPQAIRTLLNNLNGLTIPILVAQHMPAIFTYLFAERLNKQLNMTVKEATDNEEIQTNHVYIAPGGNHMEVVMERGRIFIRIYPKDDNDRYVPSVDRLFKSTAKVYGSNLMGIILTGMGDDGLMGARMIKKSGGTVLSESEESAVVYGMPKSVMEEGVSDGGVRVEEMGARVWEWVSTKLT